MAVAIGCGYGALTHLLLVIREHDVGGADFTYTWLAARFLLHGLNPYRAMVTAATPYQQVFLYPLPTAFIGVPFAWLSAHAAAVAFMTVSGGLLACALTRDGWWRLLVLASAPAFVAANSVQWSPLLTSTALWPAALGLAIVKPQLALPVVAYQTRWRAVGLAAVGALALSLIALAIQPTWPLDWLRVVRASPVTGQYHIPIITRWGCWLAFAALAWRTREGRVVLAMACVPQNFFFYDQLPLALVARTPRQALAFALASWTAYVAFRTSDWHASTWRQLSDVRIPYAMLGLYVPALAIVTLPHSAARGGNTSSHSDLRRRTPVDPSSAANSCDSA